MIHVVSMRKEGEKDAAEPTILPSKNKTMTDKHTHTQTPKNKEPPTHSKFKFQIQITRKTHEVVSGAKKITPRK
jgi:hypothetical protein